MESKSIDGITRGSYSYVDAEGRLQTVEYTADSINGFRAAATNLPKASLAGIVDTPEVNLSITVSGVSLCIFFIDHF